MRSGAGPLDNFSCSGDDNELETTRPPKAWRLSRIRRAAGDRASTTHDANLRHIVCSWPKIQGRGLQIFRCAWAGGQPFEARRAVRIDGAASRAFVVTRSTGQTARRDLFRARLRAASIGGDDETRAIRQGGQGEAGARRPGREAEGPQRGGRGYRRRHARSARARPPGQAQTRISARGPRRAQDRAMSSASRQFHRRRTQLRRPRGRIRTCRFPRSRCCSPRPPTAWSDRTTTS